jgi:hypothetical protein
VELPVVGELAEQVVRSSQIRNRAGRRSRRWSLDLGRVAKVVRVPSSSSESVLDLQAAPDLVTRVSSGTETGLTPTTRVAPPDPGHRTTPTRVCSQASTTPTTHGTATCRVAWPTSRLSPDYGSGGWGFESLAARHHHRSSAAL